MPPKASFLLRTAIICTGILVVFALAGCGGDSTTTKSGSTSSGGQGGNAAVRTDYQWTEIFEQMEATVEVTATDGIHFTYSQKNGNWRWKNEAVDMTEVYNKALNVTWTVIGGRVTDTPGDGGGPDLSPMLVFAPLEFTVPDSRSGNVLTYEITGGGKATVELNGPNELPSKLTIDTPPAGPRVIDFKYSNVGSVPDSLFQRPAGTF